MKQINIHINKDFLNDLQKVMKLKGIKTKSAAIRYSIREAVKHLSAAEPKTPYREWLGMGLKAQVNEQLRFESDDSIWGKK